MLIFPCYSIDQCQINHHRLLIDVENGVADVRTNRKFFLFNTFEIEILLSGGDRLRGITSTFILAVLTRRRFYIDMPYPCELSRLLKPNFYDWKPIKFK